MSRDYAGFLVVCLDDTSEDPTLCPRYVLATRQVFDESGAYAFEATIDPGRKPMVVGLLRPVDLRRAVEPPSLGYDQIRDAILALHRDEQYRLRYEIGTALGAFTKCEVSVEAFLEDVNDGYYEDSGLMPYSVSETAAYDSLWHVAKHSDGPEEYTPYIYEAVARELRDEGYLPQLVPMWCAGLGG